MFGHIKRGILVDYLTQDALDDLKIVAGQRLLNSVNAEATVVVCGSNIDDYIVDKVQRFLNAKVLKVGRCILVRVSDGLPSVAERVLKLVDAVSGYRHEDKV